VEQINDLSQPGRPPERRGAHRSRFAAWRARRGNGQERAMDALAFFHLRYDAAHTSMTDQLLDGLTDEQVRARPHGVNSIAWLLWHVARCEDVGVNRLVADRPQLLDEAPWPARLNAPRRDIGTGMTSDEVADLSERIDVAALRAYWDALYRRTRAILSDLPAGALSEPVDRARLRRLIAEEAALGPHAGWVGPAWAAQPNRGLFLAQLALAHHYGHLYEGFVTRGLLGFPTR
jgi:hypothetical protein